MNTNNQKEEKGGFLGVLSGLFKGGSSAAMGGGASGLGTAGGIFATKAGIVGMVLGGATIAAGIGVVYNFVGPSSKPVYSPELFQNSYIEEEASDAAQQRAQFKDRSSASASTLDMFSEQARKDGMKGLGDAAVEEDSPKDAAAEAAADEQPAAPAAPSAGAPSYGGGEGSSEAKLRSTAGFGGGGKTSGGGSSSVAPRLQNQGGMSGGIGGQFSSMYRPPAGADAGKTSRMSAMAARASNSPKYSVPNFNKKGSHSQAKFSNAMGRRGAMSSSDAGARSSAETAFSGGETGQGDVAAAGAGAGVGGAGVSNGSQLKGSDPNLSSNNSNIPPVNPPALGEPWKEYEDAALKGLLIGAGCWVGLSIMAKFANKIPKGPWTVVYIIAALALLAAAIWQLVEAFLAGLKLFQGDPDNKDGKGGWEGQGIMGGIYMAGAIMLAFMCLKEFGKILSNLEGVSDTGWGKGTEQFKTEKVQTFDKAGKPNGFAETKVSTGFSGGLGSALETVGGIPTELLGVLKGM